MNTTPKYLSFTTQGGQVTYPSHTCQRCGERPATSWYDPIAFVAGSQYATNPANLVAVCGECNPLAIHCACCSKREGNA